MILLHADGQREAMDLRILADDEPLTGTPWEAVRPSHQAIESLEARCGLALDNTIDVLSLPVAVHAFAFICLEFPSFTDGRAYSQATWLRDRLQFGGKLIATGDILRDQALYLRRCGFDAFLLADDRAADQFAPGLKDFSVAYQPSAAAHVPERAFRQANRT